VRATQKLGLTDAIARDLARRYSYKDIDTYLWEFSIPTPDSHRDANYKVTYTKDALRGVDAAILIKIAEDLEVSIPGTRATILRPPRIWPDDSKFRLFISHIAEHKDKAIRLRECLAPYEISGFVAHEDIHPTTEWQIEIERALNVMDAFLAIHTKGFSNSFWTQQEIGYAVARGVKIISLKMDREDPTGFIQKHQALARGTRSAEAIAKEVNTILSDDELTSGRLAEVNIPF
jgi:TIR domain